MSNVPKRKKISINDIAKHLNVAKSTVSLVVNGKAEERRISKVLEKRVLDYVNEVGFRPHHFARSLATGKSNSIGLIVENIGDSFFGPIALMIEEKAKQYGYRVMYSSTLGDTIVAEEIIQFFKRSQLDGYIIAPPSGLEDAVKELQKGGKPVVVFDRKIDLDVDYVGTNNFEVSREACEHLVSEGFLNIAFVTLESHQNQMLERLEGYMSCMDAFEREKIILKIPYKENKQVRKKSISQFLKKNNHIDAIFFATNYLCISGIEVIKEMKKKIPEDIGIIVFDENDFFRLYEPPITAIEQPLDDLSLKIIDTLLQKIETNKESNTLFKHVLPSNLIVRKSSKRKSLDRG